MSRPAPRGGPRFTLAGGEPLPARLNALRLLFAYAPPLVAGALRRALQQLVVPALPEMLVEMPDGRRLRISEDDTTYKQTFLCGEYEPETSRALRELAQPGQFAIDIGANQGWLSLLLAGAVGADGTVWAFEPTPPVLRRLHENLDMNKDLHVRVFDHALGDTDGEIEMHVFPDMPTVHASASTLSRRKYETYPVALRMLDSLRDEMPERPALMKLDVEGLELAVLRGARETISESDRLAIVVEVNRETSAAFGYAPSEILAELAQHRDYRIFRAGRSGLQPEHAPDQAPHGSTWVCIPG